MLVFGWGEDKVNKLECCNKILHTKCILNWFTEYNHTCPLCNHKYEHEDTPNNGVQDEEDSVDLGYIDGSIDDGSIDVEDSDAEDNDDVEEVDEDVVNNNILGDYDSYDSMEDPD